MRYCIDWTETRHHLAGGAGRAESDQAFERAGGRPKGFWLLLTGIAVVVGPAIGPTVGGVMLAHSSWQWLFLMNIPFGMVAVVLGLCLLPRTAAGLYAPFVSGGLLDFG